MHQISVLKNTSFLEREQLKDFFNRNDPFGPESSEEVERHERIQFLLFNTKNSVWKNYRDDPRIIIGRKGSGKTSIVSRTELIDRFKFIVKVDTDLMIEAVREKLSQEDHSDDILLGETSVRHWDAIINIQLMTQIVHSNPSEDFPSSQNFLASLDESGKSPHDSWFMKYIKAATNIERTHIIGNIIKSVSNIIDLYSEGYGVALDELDTFLRRNRSKAVVILDNVERYDVNNKRMRNILEGMLGCVGKYGNKNRQIRMCMPAEVYFDFEGISNAVSKDFSKSIVLHWTPIELLRIVAWRYLILVSLYDQARLNKFIHLDLDSDAAVFEVLRDFLRPSVENSEGYDEISFSYLLRHTQFMPRQLLMILNSIYRSDKINIDAMRQADVSSGLRRTEPTICADIFSAYSFKYPYARELCSRVFQKLPRFFTQSLLKEIYAEIDFEVLDPGSRWDYYKFQRVLFELGSIGRVVDSVDCYKDAEFEYAIAGQLAASEADELCVHPVFSGAHRSALNKAGKCFVHPHYSFYQSGTKPTGFLR